MYTIRTLATLAFALFANAVFAQDAIPYATVLPCFDMEERLARLACYDQVLQRTAITDTIVPDAPITSDISNETAVIAANSLLSSPYVTDEGVFVTLQDQATGGTLAALGDSGLLTSPPKNAEELGVLRRETNVFLALPSLPEIGEQAVLAISCKNNITHLQVYWYEPFANRAESVRIYYGTSLSDADNHEDRRFRVRGNGYIIENARGLDSIRLIQKMSRTQRIQVSVSVGNEIRSAFFNTNSLPSALPMTARHCSWSQS